MTSRRLRDSSGRRVCAPRSTTRTWFACFCRGGFPTVVQGKNYLRAREAGLYIRLYENGHVYCQPGKWETDVADIDKIRKND